MRPRGDCVHLSLFPHFLLLLPCCLALLQGFWSEATVGKKERVEDEEELSLLDSDILCWCSLSLLGVLSWFSFEKLWKLIKDISFSHYYRGDARPWGCHAWLLFQPPNITYIWINSIKLFWSAGNRNPWLIIVRSITLFTLYVSNQNASYIASYLSNFPRCGPVSVSTSPMTFKWHRSVRRRSPSDDSHLTWEWGNHTPFLSYEIAEGKCHSIPTKFSEKSLCLFLHIQPLTLEQNDRPKVTK